MLLKNKYKYLLLFTWMVLIFLLSNEVANVSSGRSTVIVTAVINTLHIGTAESIITFITRKAAHIFMYFILGLLIHNVIKEYKLTAKRTVFLSIVSALTYASFDEIHQLFVAGRSGELRDIIIDTTASALGIGLFYLIYHVRSTRKKNKNKKSFKSWIVKNKTQISKWARRLISVGLIASYTVAVFFVIGTRIIPIKYLGLSIFVTALIVLFITVTRLKGKLSPKKNIALTAASLLVIILSIFVISASVATSSFINNIQDNNYTYEEYDIIAKKDQHININTSNKQNVAILKTDKNNDLVKAELKNKVNANYKEYNDLTSITAALDSHEVDMAVVKASHIDLLKENYDVFYQKIEILMTIKIKVKTIGDIVPADTTKPFVIYISGIDTYGAISTVSRSDVNILACVNPVTHKILLVTTPRDYYVQLHDTTGVKDKLTHAGIYGIDMSINTLEDLYATKIDYYLRVNFSSLTKIIDAIGGVEVNSAYSFSAGGYWFNTGLNQLNGAQALAFSRERHSFEEGDRTRGENQERVIEAIIAKINNPINLINYQQIISSLTDVFQTNMSPDSITSLINTQLNNMKKWQTESISVTGTGSTNATYSMGNMPLYVMVPDIASLEFAKTKILQQQ